MRPLPLLALLLCPVLLDCADHTIATPGPRVPDEPASTFAPTHMTSAEVPGPSTLSDAQITAITSAANDDLIDQAQAALARTDEPRVKSFAEQMLRDHSLMRDEQDQLLARLHIAPGENGLSSKIRNEGVSTLDTLRTDTGAEFDRAYMEAQVKEHKDFLDMVDQKLLPGAKNGELRTRLLDVRDTVAKHLQEAQQILDSLPK